MIKNGLIVEVASIITLFLFKFTLPIFGHSVQTGLAVFNKFRERVKLFFY